MQVLEGNTAESIHIGLKEKFCIAKTNVSQKINKLGKNVCYVL